MKHPGDPISEADLHAYVDGQLSPRRRIAVEAHLARNPDLAAQLMADLRGNDELRLAMSDMPAMASLATQHAARRLEKGLARDVSVLKLRRVAAAIILIAAGWFAHVEFLAIGNWTTATTTASAMPAYVDDAARAHRTALLRASMQSQPLQPNYDASEIRAVTSISVPELPENWKILDVQIFPSSAGPALEMAIEAENLGTLSLFAVRPGGFDVMPATITSSKDTTAVYWQIGDVAYTLIGASDENALNEAAMKLASPLY